MPKNDKDKYKYQLRQYLAGKGIQPGENGNYHCISPDHADSDPSLTFYEDNQGRGNYVNCNSCGFKGDIFDCAGALIGSPDFSDQIKDIIRVIGDDIKEKPILKQKKKVDAVKWVSLTRKEAKKVYTDRKVLDYANFVLNKDKGADIPEDDERYKKLIINKFWAYYNAVGDIDLMVVRFDYEDLKKKKQAKDVLTYYWDGKSMKMKAYPVLLYNRNKLAEIDGLHVLFHEGEKCCDLAGKDLVDFCHLTWNGGGKKFDKVQGLEATKGRKIFILGDDDKPGQETAMSLQARLKKEFGFESFLVPPFPKAREIKKKGADIEEILQVYTPAEITEIILRSEHGNQNNSSENAGIKTKSENNGGGSDSSDNLCARNSSDDNNYPFQILGVADDTKAYFIDHKERLIGYNTISISENILCDLGTYAWFKMENGARPPTKDEWMEQIDYVRIVSKSKDFDIENIKGRGAWRTKQGDICYYDGINITGTPDPDWKFVRKPKRDLGIKGDEADLAVRMEIMEISKRFTLKTDADNVRLLAWAVLAPFGGALKWRPMLLGSGESGTGKSTIMDNIVEPIAKFMRYNGTTSTEAAIRQYTGIDSTPNYVEECESRTPKDRDRVEGIFALGRGGSTDDAPKTVKGSANGVAVVYEMKSMFSFAAINPSVDNVADDNRIIRINFKEPGNIDKFLSDIKEASSLLSKKNCDGIRAFTWNNLEEIISLGERLFIVIQKITGQSARFAAGESILLAANMIVWEGLEANSDEFLAEYVSKFYENVKLDERRDETNEMIERLLDETVIAGDHKEPFSFRELLIEMKKFVDDKHFEKSGDWDKRSLIGEVMASDKYRHYKRIVEQNGLSVHGKTRELFIAQNHHQVKTIIGIGNGYHRQLERHKNVINPENGSFANIDGTTKRGVIIGGFLGYGGN